MTRSHGRPNNPHPQNYICVLDVRPGKRTTKQERQNSKMKTVKAKNRERTIKLAIKFATNDWSTVKAFLVAPKTTATDSTVSTFGPLSGDRRVALDAI